MTLPNFSFAHQIADAIKSEKVTATVLTKKYLHDIEKINPSLNAYTEICAGRALKKAATVDALLEAGKDPGPLAGVPFAVKNLFDIQNVTTLAGSKINSTNVRAKEDAVLVKRLEDAGGVLLGAVAMGEYAYDFTGENAHYGNCANPWDLTRMSGGSSSGCGSATAGGIAPLSLGSDTNGSIRVPASFCGVFGLKPTYGRLPRTGTYPFCDSLDHLGAFARSVTDLAMCFDVLQGFDQNDHACIERKNLSTMMSLGEGINNLRIKKAKGYFYCEDFPEAHTAIEKVCSALPISDEVELVGSLEGRSAAYLITNVESSALHKKHLQTQAKDFDPDTRDRFIAGALLPASWYVRAQQVRQWYRKQVENVFADTDVIIAPATPCTAPKMGAKTISIRGEEQPLRPNLGYFTQPISAIGLPSLVVPTYDPNNNLPIGVQIIAAPWREDHCFRVAKYLEDAGFMSKQVCPGF